MEKPIIVAELSINHLGMVKIAKEMILAAKEAGADYVKLKKKSVVNYYSGESAKKWRNFSFTDYRASLELSEEDFYELDAYSKSISMPWFATIHDYDSLEFMTKFDIPFYKLASSDAKNISLLDRVLDCCVKNQNKLIVSVGGSNLSEIERTVKKIEKKNIEAYVLHTVSIYPTPSGESNMSKFKKMRELFAAPKIKFGYSGHEEGMAASLLATFYGAQMIERHFALSRDYKIHHIKTALVPDELANMVTLIREINQEQSRPLVECYDNENRFLREKIYE